MPSIKIPVSFTHNGEEYKGYFESVIGGGALMFHLNVNGYYIGQMFMAEISDKPGEVVQPKDKKYGLRFYSQKGDLDYLADYFISVVLEWYGNNPVE